MTRIIINDNGTITVSLKTNPEELPEWFKPQFADGETLSGGVFIVRSFPLVYSGQQVHWNYQLQDLTSGGNVYTLAEVELLKDNPRQCPYKASLIDLLKLN